MAKKIILPTKELRERTEKTLEDLLMALKLPVEYGMEDGFGFHSGWISLRIDRAEMVVESINLLNRLLQSGMEKK